MQISQRKIIPKPIESDSITKYVREKLEEVGLRTRKILLHPSKSSRYSEAARHRNEIHPCHSFRIFAVTNMQRSRIDKTIREMLAGHSTGLDRVYYKPQDEEILQEYLKAIDLLTISKEHRLEKQLDYYKERNDNEKIDRLENDIESLRAGMNNMFMLIQQNPLLAHIKPKVLEQVK